MVAPAGTPSWRNTSSPLSRMMIVTVPGGPAGPRAPGAPSMPSLPSRPSLPSLPSFPAGPGGPSGPCSFPLAIASLIHASSARISARSFVDAGAGVVVGCRGCGCLGCGACRTGWRGCVSHPSGRVQPPTLTPTPTPTAPPRPRRYCIAVCRSALSQSTHWRCRSSTLENPRPCAAVSQPC
jgi:hypothetical protein